MYDHIHIVGKLVMAKLPSLIMAITTKYPICCVYSNWGIHNVTTKGQPLINFIGHIKFACLLLCVQYIYQIVQWHLKSTHRLASVCNIAAYSLYTLKLLSYNRKLLIPLFHTPWNTGFPIITILWIVIPLVCLSILKNPNTTWIPNIHYT